MDQESCIPRDRNLLRPNQHQLLQEEVASLKEQLKDPAIQFKNKVVRRVREVEKQLEVGSPQSLQGEQKDRVARRVKTLVDKVRVGMLTNEELRKAPVGAVDRLRKWERHNKKDITELKNGLLMLAAGQGDYTGEETDVANLEKFRPWSPSQGYRANAIIEGQMAYQNPQAQAGFDLIFPDGPTADTAYKQALRASGVPIDEQKRVLSEEERAQKREWLAKARAVLKEKRAAAASSGMEKVEA